MTHKKAMLVILDGWGYGPKTSRDAIATASTPFFDRLIKEYPNSRLITYGPDVGLPPGQMGNSEVGHLNIGAGRVVYQELARIHRSIAEGSFFQNEVLLQSIQQANKTSGRIHLMGLLSDGGVHSHISHLKALCNLCDQQKVAEVYIHAFLDGRDVDPRSGLQYLEELQNHIEGTQANISSVIGRYYSMDRDNRWERTAKAYQLLVNGQGIQSTDILSSIQAQYNADISDEFVEAHSCKLSDGLNGNIKAGDTVIFFNFRTDRPRQITQALIKEDMEEHAMHKLPLQMISMTSYDKTFDKVKVLYKKADLTHTLGQVIADAGLHQLRVAETEKYPHVTFFFSGGRELAYPNEHRILVPSPKVATYDLQPEMSAKTVTEKTIDYININKPDFVCLNYANTDMVGHTGVFEAGQKAATCVDGCLEELVNNALEKDYEVIVIADHGNADYMINDDGSPHTAHTTNPVPCIYVSKHLVNKKIRDGILADIAPTILKLMGVECSEQMTGQSLL